MKFYCINLLLIYSIFIIYINSQENKIDIDITDEKHLFNKNLLLMNRTDALYQEISEKMKNIIFNIYLKLKYRNLKKNNEKIQTKFSLIKGKLDNNIYDKQIILEELKELNGKLLYLETLCETIKDLYEKNERNKIVFFNLFKVLFITLILTIIVVMAIIKITPIFEDIKTRKYLYSKRRLYKKHIILLDENREINTFISKKNNYPKKKNKKTRKISVFNLVIFNKK